MGSCISAAKGTPHCIFYRWKLYKAEGEEWCLHVGEFIGNRYSNERDTYPDNGRYSDGFWYVYDGRLLAEVGTYDSQVVPPTELELARFAAWKEEMEAPITLSVPLYGVGVENDEILDRTKRECIVSGPFTF
ncbi:hypothetical protein [uncultured Duncaniella sp.]|uniref:hypothetical protein n=1 Tax=uncultured Duncaniella sp. TaxID=2768039 RepID=UPI00260A3A43|nr:hypothetical protein [uncultured Duncaniella sp.]